LIIASDNDELIALIRGSKIQKKHVRVLERLTVRYQSKIIVEMRLRQLTGLEQDKLNR
jgi:DNA gyrase subunit A